MIMVDDTKYPLMNSIEPEPLWLDDTIWATFIATFSCRLVGH